MKMHTPAASAMTIPVEKKLDDIKQNFWFRVGIFTVSAAGGIIFTRLLHAGFTLLPLIGDGAHDKAGPVVAILKLLHSGLGN